MIQLSASTYRTGTIKAVLRVDTNTLLWLIERGIIAGTLHPQRGAQSDGRPPRVTMADEQLHAAVNTVANLRAAHGELFIRKLRAIDEKTSAKAIAQSQGGLPILGRIPEADTLPQQLQGIAEALARIESLLRPLAGSN